MTIKSAGRVRRRIAAPRRAGPVGRPKVRSDDEQTAIIVEVAMELFLDLGFSEMKMADIATGCAISKRTLYRLFPSKIHVFRALVEAHRATMVHFPPGIETQPLDDALAEIFRIDLEDAEDDRRRRFIARAVEEARQLPEIGAILHEQGGERTRGLLADWLAKWKNPGTGGLENPLAAASILTDMMFGAILRRQFDPPYWPGGNDRQAYLRECIRCFVNGAARA